ncbi:MAG: hypothetical protein AAGC53_19555 [Actinomycetota bacterium]
MTDTSLDTFETTDIAASWAEWPDSDLDIDDDEFAAAIAQGREPEQVG